MAVDPNIARGITPLGLGVPEIVMGMERQRQGRNALALDEQGLGIRRNELAYRQQGDQNALKQQADDREMEYAYGLLKSGDPSFAVRKMSEAHPEFARLAQQDPDKAAQAAEYALAQRFGETVEKPKPMPELRSLGGGVQAIMQGNDIVGSPQFPQRPAPPGPESFSDFTDAGGAVHLIGNRGSIRGTPLRGQLNTGRDRPIDTGMKASDSNSIVSAAARAFGGVYDPLSGNISGLKQDDLLNLNRVASRASDLFLENNGQVPHATAVQRALEEFRGGGKPAGGTPGRNPPARRRPDYASEQEAQAALDAGHLRAGDTVYINGKPAFRVE